MSNGKSKVNYPTSANNGQIWGTIQAWLSLAAGAESGIAALPAAGARPLLFGGRGRG